MCDRRHTWCMGRRLVLAAVCVSVLAAACSTSQVELVDTGAIASTSTLSPSISTVTPPLSSTTATPPTTGITGTMTATGGRAGTPDSPATGQILIWATTESAPATTVGLAPRRPLQAIATSGEFTVELEPGFYVVRGTELGGLVCGEVTVEVAPREMTKVDFLCQHR